MYCKNAKGHIIFDVRVNNQSRKLTEGDRGFNKKPAAIAMKL
jgi:hypothetical protein